MFTYLFFVIMSLGCIYIISGTTSIGRKDAEEQQDIVLTGLNIQKRHCNISVDSSRGYEGMEGFYSEVK